MALIAQGMGGGGWEMVGGRQREERGWSSIVFVGEAVLPEGWRRED